VVVFDGVTKVYGPVTAVNGLSFTLRRGETVAFLGPNGAGKSTSLDMLLGLRRPTSGAITLFGTSPTGAIESGRVGAMLQSGGLMTDVTVRELVALCAALHPKPLPIDQTLRRADLNEFADRKVDKLSGGQKQRVRFALAIVGKSDLLVLDEPTSAMDVETRQAFWSTMKAEAAGGRTVVFATHYLEEADQVADRIIVINKGRLLADGTPADIKAKAGAKHVSFRLEGAEDLTMRRDPARPGADSEL
jgi:ABC-2 type transport system ATP-binding protein